MFYLIAASLILGSIAIAELGSRSREGLERNWLAGLRTPTTMASDEAFRVANQKIWELYYAMATALFFGGVGVVVLGLLKASNDTLALFILGDSFIVMVLTAIQYVLGIKAAKSVTEKRD